jgi:hypothetical protein
VSESLRDRLARLRREEPARAPRAPLPDWLRARLGARGGPAPTATAVGGERRAGPPDGLAPVAGPQGEHAARTTRLPAAHAHGQVRLEEARAQVSGALQLVTRGDAPREIDLEACVFLDIETTGLSGGAGIHTFLVGLAWFEGDEVVVRQSFLEGPEHERALLAWVAERLARARLLVTFFGKSFDRHRLEDKMRHHGLRAPFAELAHADLYWPCRRLYAPQLPDTRLATMERALCGVERTADLSGAHAPEAWFDFLAGRAHRLEQVFRHNFDDVLSLITLAAHLSRATAGERVDGSALEGDAALAGAREVGLAELEAARGEFAAALAWLERALARAPLDAARARLEARRAEWLARLGRREEALELWGSLADRECSALGATACVQAAALALRTGRLARARHWIERGAGLASACCAGNARAALEHRVASLRARLDRLRGA